MRRVVCTLFGLVLLLVVAGCSPKATTGPKAVDAKTVKIEPWVNLLNALRKQSDAAGCRLALSQLSADLSETNAAPPTLSDAQLAFARDQLRAAPNDQKELTANTYTNLDAAYLAECLFFRDAARSFDLAGVSPDRQAAIAFAWTCRMVYLRPGVSTQSSQQGLVLLPPIPPSYVVRRGYGLAIERAMVFLALLQQMGLDGCLVGLGGREQEPGMKIVNNQPRAPFWAVGARGPDGAIYLFDPQRGEAFPAQAPLATATLAQVVANPALLQPWFDDKVTPYDLKPDDIKAATVYLAAPFSAGTPRMKKLDEQISQEVHARLAIDLQQQLTTFGPNTKLWAPGIDRDPSSYSRVLASFLLIQDGGNDPTPANDLSVFRQTMEIDSVPRELLPLPAEIQETELRLKVVNMFFLWHKSLFQDYVPREKLARGQFNEVARQMTDIEQRLAIMREGFKSLGGPSAMLKWSQDASQIAQKLSLARLPQNKDQLPQAQVDEQNFWQNPGNSGVLQASLFAPLGQAEASLLLALSKHEQAERAQIRWQRTAPTDRNRTKYEGNLKDAWANAKDAWERASTSQTLIAARQPERAAQIQKLMTRAAKMNQDPTGW